MAGMIQGIHHIAVKPTPENYERTVKFYTELLGMKVVQSWGDPVRPCLMVSCGDNSCMEILCGESDTLPAGPLNHIAFATDKVDEIIEKVRAQGYEVTVEPKDTNLNGTENRIAFFYGPVHEHIELFWVK